MFPFYPPQENSRCRQTAYTPNVTCPQGGTIEILNLKDWKMEEPIRLTKGVDGMAWVFSATN